MMANSSTTYIGLWKWYRVNLRGSYGQLGFTFLLIGIMLATQAVVPLQVESILHHGEWDSTAVGILIALVILMMVTGHFGHLGAHDLAVHSGERLRNRVFDRLMHGRSEGINTLVRPSIVSRHTTDVSNVSGGFELTVGYGIPAVIKIIQSLVILIIIAPRAGVAMVVAVILFIVIRHLIGKQMLQADRQALEAGSSLGEVVDEAITSTKQISGLHLIRWIEGRFSSRNGDLAHAEHRQGILATRLLTSAHGAGLIGLVVVVMLAISSSTEEIAVVAASLLYIEAVVAGLEVLPTWIKSLQLAVASRRRIDEILIDAATPASEPLIDLSSKRIELTGESLGVSPGSIVGLVTTPDIDIDTLMSVFAGNDNPLDWRMTTDGHLIRLSHVNPEIQQVTAEPLTVNASPMAYFRGVVDDIEESRGIELLQAVGLQELVERRFEEIGPAGNRLTVNQRQRLALACALAAAPRVLLLGPILALADAETAMPLIASLRGQGIELIVIATRDVDVAHEVSRLIFADGSGVTTGSHQDLLVNNPRYARLWEGRLLTSDVDLSVLGLGEEAGDSLYAKLVTEHFEPGTPLYRTGDPADRVIFVISGHIEIATRDAQGNSRRVAVLAPGMHCGDLRLTVGEKRAEDATAVDNAVVRSLSRGAISAGMSGMLDRAPSERKIVSLILRAGSLSVPELEAELTDMDPAELQKALDLLRQDGAIKEVDGVMSVVQKRAVKSGAAEILDRIGGL